MERRGMRKDDGGDGLRKTQGSPAKAAKLSVKFEGRMEERSVTDKDAGVRRMRMRRRTRRRENSGREN